MYAFKGGQSQAKLKKAAVKMAVIQFRRGSSHLFFKNSHTEEEFLELDFLKRNFRLVTPDKLREQGRGIPSKKKDDIIKKLCPLMPVSRRQF